MHHLREFHVPQTQRAIRTVDKRPGGEESIREGMGKGRKYIVVKFFICIVCCHRLSLGRGCYVKSVGIKNYDEKLMGIPGA